MWLVITLLDNISLVDSSDVPRIASTSEIADTVMSLVMESSNLGWLTKGATTFKTDGNLPTGTLEYDSENSNVIPTLLFYLYHSKNLSTTARLGSVKILLKVETPIDAISSKFEENTANSRSNFYKGINSYTNHSCKIKFVFTFVIYEIAVKQD